VSSQPVTYEHLAFPGLDPGESEYLERELELIESSARLFASGLCGLDVQISWSLGRAGPVTWMQSPDGTLSVHLWIDLLSPRNLPAGSKPFESDPLGNGSAAGTPFLQAFRTGFLHALGRVLGAPAMAGLQPATIGAGDPISTADLTRSEPLDWVLRPHHPRWRRLPTQVRARLAEHETADAVRGLLEHLEGARTDALLMRRFAGAVRHLQPRFAGDRELSRSSDPVAALLGLLALEMRAAGSGGPAGVDAGVSGAPELEQAFEVRKAFARLAPMARLIAGSDDAEAAYRLAEFAVYDLLPVLLALGDIVVAPDPTDLGDARDGTRLLNERRGIAQFCGFTQEVAPDVAQGSVGTVLVTLPHMVAGHALFRIDHAIARDLLPDEVLSRVLRGMAAEYGPPALEAFAEQAGPLRRALRVNWERREQGRFRSGTHVGITNLRRFVISEDLRLFQRLKAPQALSYYFHVLVDVSYSMLQGRNAEKALAIAYAFTDLLTTARVPVDVTLYSSGVTELHDHQRDTLEPWFGGSFGYLMSGTLEMEAIAFAKQKADRLRFQRKIFVVMTDGTPATTSLPAVGARSLHEYYEEGLLPWLTAAGIEVVAVGLGVQPDYHRRAVALTEGWDALGVFVDLLEEIVREGAARSRDLWE
jgi:hypothetical protein